MCVCDSLFIIFCQLRIPIEWQHTQNKQIITYPFVSFQYLRTYLNSSSTNM